MMGYNFTDSVRAAFTRAREEASALGHEYIGTEHLLLGIVAQDKLARRRTPGGSLLGRAADRRAPSQHRPRAPLSEWRCRHEALLERGRGGELSRCSVNV